MTSLLASILSILVMAEFVLGKFANVFIALVNCIDWVKGQKISCVDRILTALAISRIGLLWSMVLHWHLTAFNTAFNTLEVRIAVSVAWLVSNHFSLWFAACLSTLYLLKIASFSSRFFLHLKWKAKRVVLMILLGTLILLVFQLAVVSIDEKMWVNENEGNTTWKTNFRDIVHLSNMTVFMIVLFIPFFMSLAALLLLLFSLWKHLRKMQLSGKGSQDTSTKVHIRAMQTVASFLLLFAIYFLTLIISSWSSESLQNGPVFLCGQVLATLYPSNHSFILIWGHKKLNQIFLSVLWQLRCWLRERKPSTP